VLSLFKYLPFFEIVCFAATCTTVDYLHSKLVANAHHDVSHHEHEYREEIAQEWITNMKVIGGLIHEKPELFRDLMGAIVYRL
jgi:hypothetical protein